MSEPKPTATGTLQVTPLAHLLVYVLDRRLDGTLVLETPDHQRSAVCFEEGAPTKAKTAEPVIYLGRLLLERGAIDEATYNRTLAEVAERRQLHGQILLGERALDRETLNDALREQVSQQVLWLCTLPLETMYGFYEGQNLLAGWGGPDAPRVKPLALLWRVVRLYATPATVESALARLGGSELRFHVDAQLARFHFGAHEQAVIDVLRMKPHTLEALIKLELADAQFVERLVYLLVITRHLDSGIPGSLPVGVDEPPSSSRIELPKTKGKPLASSHGRLTTGGSRLSTGQRPAPAPHTGATSSPHTGSGDADDASRLARRISTGPPHGDEQSPSVVAFKKEIHERAEAMSGQNYYTILGVDRDANDSTIQAAFFQLAKRWHPDRLGIEYADVREAATRVFSRMSEAHHVLIDADQRRDYDAVLGDGGGSVEDQEQVQQVLRAATTYQKAQVLLKKHDLAGAEEHALRALADDPAQADYMALVAWIQAQRPDCDNARLAESIALLNQAVSREPNNERARFYRGQLLKRTGKTENAMRDFRWIVHHNPKNIDAEREMRLYAMRHSTSPRAKKRDDPDAKGSLLGKLFKR